MWGVALDSAGSLGAARHPFCVNRTAVFFWDGALNAARLAVFGTTFEKGPRVASLSGVAEGLAGRGEGSRRKFPVEDIAMREIGVIPAVHTWLDVMWKGSCQVAWQ